MIATLQSQSAHAPTTFRQGNPSFGMRGEEGLHIMIGEEDLEVGVCLPNLDGGGSLNHRDLPLSLVQCIPNKSRGLQKLILTTNVGSVGKWDT